MLKKFFSAFKREPKVVELRSEEVGPWEYLVTAKYDDGREVAVVYAGLSPEAGDALRKRNLAYAKAKKDREAKASKK